MFDLKTIAIQAVSCIIVFGLIAFMRLVLKTANANQPEGIKRNIEAIMQCTLYALIIGGVPSWGLYQIAREIRVDVINPISVVIACMVVGLGYIYLYKPKSKKD